MTATVPLRDQHDLTTRRAPRGRRIELAHLGGLDGLRGVAVLGVILYHGGFADARGGFLGVEAFFVLSGFLITSLLVAEWLASGTIVLRNFWARRARRLLPALLLLVVVIGFFYASAGPSRAVPGFLGDGLSALFYYSNWHQIAIGTDYFAASGPISPFQHTWSLAIEEQFYVVWPLLILGFTWLLARLAPSGSALGRLRLLLVLTIAGAFVSLIDAGVQFDGGSGLDRVYYGTDTRASGLLAGAALAIFLTIRRLRAADSVGRRRTAPGPGPRAAELARRIGNGSFLLIAVLVLAMELASGSAAWLYPYGFALLDVTVVGIIACVALLPDSAANRMLSVRPLQFTGRISYGLYLWHFPLFLWLDTAGTGLDGTALLALRLVVTFGVSLLSYVVVEQPIRQRRAPAWMVRGAGATTAVTALAALFIGASASALPTAVPTSARLPAPSARLAGTSPACTVTLTDTAGYGVAPVPASQEATFEYTSLGKHRLTWSGSARKTFTTCPPKRVLLIGDSIAFTLGVPMFPLEQHYGTEVANAANLGCAFSTRGELDVNGTWETPSSSCATALQQWSADEQQFRPDVVLVELGYRDEFDWRWNGALVHLGERAFDSYVQAQIDNYVSVLGAHGTKIVFLTVPYTHPPDQADGSPAPAASPQRHATINAMLSREAALHPKTVRLIDIDQTISPGNQYNARINGQMCRFDGIHFTVYCAQLLVPQILGQVRSFAG